MTTTTTREPLNGVDVPALFATIDAVAAQPAAATFQFRATTRWVRGTHSRTTIDGFYGAGEEQHHRTVTHVAADHPEVLTGDDEAPTPVEHLLHALGACLTAGIGNIAAARGVPLTSVTSELEGDIDLLGLLGLDDDVRNGFERIRVHVTVAGDGTAEQLRAVVAQSVARSAVFDVVTNGVPVEIHANGAPLEVDTGRG